MTTITLQRFRLDVRLEVLEGLLLVSDLPLLVSAVQVQALDLQALVARDSVQQGLAQQGLGVEAALEDILPRDRIRPFSLH